MNLATVSLVSTEPKRDNVQKIEILKSSEIPTIYITEKMYAYHTGAVARVYTELQQLLLRNFCAICAQRLLRLQQFAELHVIVRTLELRQFSQGWPLNWQLLLRTGE